MSFQGDVAGIGLGELLQGLSRGGRDGVLTLYGDVLSAALGLLSGQLYILNGPDEEEGHWRERTQRAWADDPQPAMETTRRASIARAARLECLYQLLEAPNLHFRFEPGPLPPPPSFARKIDTAISLTGESAPTTRDNPWGPGMTVEYMLLEHARIADESSQGPGARLSSHDMPRALDIAKATVEERDFLTHCDGSSTILEIADRLGWTLSQCRQTVGQHLIAENLRLAQPRELLASMQRELEQGRIGRAGTRLTGWVKNSPPGQPTVGDADLLVGEWEAGRIGHILHILKPAVGRALLRKLDAVHMDVSAARQRWQALHEISRSDDITLLHEVALRLAATEDPEARTFHDLLRLARSFQERGFEARTRTLLRLATNHMPSKPQTRVELGRRMLETGLIEDGTRWLLDTARELIKLQDGERAMVPIRAVLREIPDHSEASGLLIETQGLLAKKKRRRWNTVAVLSTGLILALAALVQFHAYRQVEKRLTEIRSHMHDPELALARLKEEFGDSQSQGVTDLRTQLMVLRMQAEERELVSWQRRYEEIQEQCEFGDTVLGLRRVLEFPPPPTHRGDQRSWQERQDLLGLLAKRFGEQTERLDLPPDATDEELSREQSLLAAMEEVLRILPTESLAPEITSFRFRVSELQESTIERRDSRAVERVKMIEKLRQKDQNILLATARSHHKAGDLARSLQAYQLLVEADQELASLPELVTEIDTCREQWDAVRRARELCQRGEHEAAEAELIAVCPRPVEFPMTWRVDSRPSGARVILGDGTVRVAPFEMRSGFGEEVILTFELRECVSRTITLTKPRDLLVSLHVHPERSWRNDHAIEAAPVPVGDDHVVSDRAGMIRRLDAESEASWRLELRTLGGIARTPVFLPGKPGHLLILSEDGLTWLVNASTGKAEGPRDIGSPPVEGPTITRGGVSAQFADGRVALWTTGLEPSFYDSSGLIRSTDHRSSDVSDHNSSLVILRRSVEAQSTLSSPWTDWVVEPHGDEYRIQSPDQQGFTVERFGDWSFLAWESPKALIPLGRLWVSDERGLRSFLPDRYKLVDID
jgi:hypothetical protein